MLYVVDNIIALYMPDGMLERCVMGFCCSRLLVLPGQMHKQASVSQIIAQQLPRILKV